MQALCLSTTAIAAAVAACSGVAQAQSPCNDQIDKFRSQLQQQQQQIDSQVRQEVRQLLNAAEDEPPEDCRAFLRRAQQVVSDRARVQISLTGEQSGQPQQAQAQQQQAQQQGSQQQAERGRIVINQAHSGSTRASSLPSSSNCAESQP